MKYKNLFKAGKLGTRTVKNRIVMSPMGDNMANADGSIGDQYIQYYARRAKGGAGIIGCGVICVDYPNGKSTSNTARLDDIMYVKDWERFSREIHRYGALLIPQIHHAGSMTDIITTQGTKVSMVSPKIDDGTGKIDMGSKFSAEGYQKEDATTHILTVDEIKALEQKFIDCAKYAQMANCDGVELHGAHGYLISQFATTGVNLRDDEYGGSLENRLRFGVNIIKGIRKACGADFIIGIRMQVHNWSTDSMTDEESIAMAQAYERAGADFIDASGGYTPHISDLMESNAHAEGSRVVLAEKIRPHINIALSVVGKLRTPEYCDELIGKGTVDFVTIGRQLICDPDWPNKAKAGKDNEIRRCLSCLDGCYGALARYSSVRCVLNPEVGYENEMNFVPAPKKSKNVIVVGGGLAGMQAAITAASRGHEVTILEGSDKLGGQMNIASVPPHKEEIGMAMQWFEGEIGRQNVNVKYNVKATKDIVMSYKPDSVIVATGAKPVEATIPGFKNTTQAWDILSGKAEAPENQNVVIVGGGIVGCELANYLYERGNRLTIIEMLPELANGLIMALKFDMLEEFSKKGINGITEAVVTNIAQNQVTYTKGGETVTLDADYIASALGQKSVGQELYNDLLEAEVEVTMVGDANKPSKFIDATREGFFAGLNL